MVMIVMIVMIVMLVVSNWSDSSIHTTVFLHYRSSFDSHHHHYCSHSCFSAHCSNFDGNERVKTRRKCHSHQHRSDDDGDDYDSDDCSDVRVESQRTSTSAPSYHIPSHRPCD